MAITIPTLHKSRTRSVIQVVMPFVRAVSQAVLVTCVLDATGELFYPNLPKHSLSLYLCRLGSVVLGFVLVKAVQWRRETTK